jgi:hypothetical protein
MWLPFSRPASDEHWGPPQPDGRPGSAEGPRARRRKLWAIVPHRSSLDLPALLQARIHRPRGGIGRRDHRCRKRWGGISIREAAWRGSGAPLSPPPAS